jgi:anthranilate/para-aminobenzoate synthase component I
MLTPASLKKIHSLYEEGYAVPLVLESAETLPPWDLYQRVYAESPHSFFFDSLRYDPPAQRYSYLGWRPFFRAFFQGGTLTLDGEISRQKKTSDPLCELREIFLSFKVAPGFSFDFFTGGAVGYFGYELAEAFDRISFRRKKGPFLPKLGLLFFRDVVVFDHKEERYLLITWLIPKKGISFRKALSQAEQSLAEMEGAFSLCDREALNGHFRLAGFRPELSQEAFERRVKRAKAYIKAGDIYQANLSQRFSFGFQGSPLTLYDRLRQANPSPFSAALHLDELFVASSSPELLVSKRGRDCVTRPIAGTRPRGRKTRETERLARELLASEKERAEHLMLVDLERNDLGRVSEWRSVRVKEFMRLEKYARVIHIVSEIVSRLRPSKDAWDLIRAIFPGGTITGCPKIRSMEIIDELEPAERGVYTGSIGYVGFDGNLKLNIAIRTLVLLRERGYLQVGAGIVADSDPAREYEETLHKGEALAEALLQASEAA